MYLKLAIPGLFALLIEWTNFEIGTFASASLDEDQLALMSIAQQVLFIFDQVNFEFFTFFDLYSNLKY
jgi:hypothetical protein